MPGGVSTVRPWVERLRRRRRMIRQAHTYLAGAVSGTALDRGGRRRLRPARLAAGAAGTGHWRESVGGGDAALDVEPARRGSADCAGSWTARFCWWRRRGRPRAPIAAAEIAGPAAAGRQSRPGTAPAPASGAPTGEAPPRAAPAAGGCRQLARRHSSPVRAPIAAMAAAAALARAGDQWRGGRPARGSRPREP